MVSHIINAFRLSGIKDINLVVGHGADLVRKTIGEEVRYILQTSQQGTAHAVLQAQSALDWKGKNVFVFVGDSPLISVKSIQALEEAHLNSGADCTFLTADFALKLPYARIIKDAQGKLIRVVEEQDATEKEKEVTELLSSHFLFKADTLFQYLPQIKAHPKTGEFYLTDILDLFLKNNLKIETLSLDDFSELVGLNTPEDVAWAENEVRARV
jgi:bifunctional N-acetylglucosamine-1-phosphate-uridyltransferase/glucosamine-1-phosphate-acetyltransferase GlmU-like protein